LSNSASTVTSWAPAGTANPNSKTAITNRLDRAFNRILLSMISGSNTILFVFGHFIGSIRLKCRISPGREAHIFISRRSSKDPHDIAVAALQSALPR
jgi:hypothetical protein